MMVLHDYVSKRIMPLQESTHYAWIRPQGHCYWWQCL
jgi:hypothetical protein